MKIKEFFKKLLRHYGSAFFVFMAIIPLPQASHVNAITLQAVDIYDNKYIGEEILKERTENSKTTYLGNNKFAVDVYKAPIHYKDNYDDPNEQWKDIDLTIENGRITKAPYNLTIDYINKSIVVVDKKTSATIVIGLNELGGLSPGVQSAYIEKGKVTFSNVAIDTDVVIVASNSNIRFKRILKSDLAPTSAKFNIIQFGNGINIDYQARDNTFRTTEIKVITTIKDGILTEDIDKTKIKNLKYPLEIDPSVDLQISASADDCHKFYHSEWQFHTNLAQTLYIGAYNASYCQYGCGLRFQNVTVPQGVTIDTAYISGYANDAYSGNGAVAWTSKVRIQDNLNPSAFSDLTDFNARSWYATTVTWSGTLAWTNGNWYDSPSLTTLVAHITDNTSWSSGNAMAFSWDDFDDNCAHSLNRRCVEQYDTDSTHAMKLHIEYTNPIPVVTTQAATNVEETTATGNATLTDNASSAVTFRGICYDTSTGVDVYDNYVGDNSTGFELGAFTESLTGLTEGTLYYAKGFAMNANGYGYGSEITFLTKPLAPTSFSATAGDNQTVLAFSIPVSADNIIIRFETDGTYPTDPADGTLAYEGTTLSYTHTGLNNGTTYKYRAWSVASGGGWTQYSDSYLDDEATPVAVATMITIDATSVEETTADLNGGITDLRGAGNCSVRGFEYDIDSGSPYAFETHENGSFGVDNYTLSISSLIEGELYYFRSYSTNVNGNGYGSELTFLTKPEAPTLFNAAAISETEIVLTWTAGIGADNTTVRAKLGSYPTDRTDGTEIYNNTGVIYIHSGLASGETWYYRAWSVASEGGWTQYSDSYSEDYAQTYVAPTVTTGICSGSSTTWAILNGEVTDAGVPSTITQRGFDYGLTTGYGSSEVDAVSAGVGEYYNLLTGLSKSTVYHYRAKVYNGAWAYGEDKIFATKGSPALWDYFITASDNVSSVYGVNWYAQTFTTDNTTGRTVTSIRIPLDRTGTSPGTVTVSLRNTAGGVPTGVDLCYGSLNGNAMATTETWYDFEMNTETTLELNTQYAIVVRASSGTATDYVDWSFVNAGGVDNGTGCTSVNSGITWSTESWDYLFELWGNQAIEIQDAKVFLSYKSTGDWLIACRYVNTFAPYYDTYDIKRYFAVQLINSEGDILASNPITEWGNKVGSIYLSASQVTGLEWNGDYRVRIRGLFTGTPYTEYALAQADWLGDDLTNLDSWCFTSAAVMADYQDEELLINIATRGTVLNAAGGDLLTAGIPGLATIRPDIFQIYTTPTEYTPETTTQTYRQETSSWQEGWGEDGTIMLTRFGNLVGVQGNQIGMMFFIALSVVIALVAFPAGHTIASVILSVIGLIAGVGMGLDIIWLALIGLIAAFLLYKQIFLDK